MKTPAFVLSRVLIIVLFSYIFFAQCRRQEGRYICEYKELHSGKTDTIREQKSKRSLNIDLVIKGNISRLNQGLSGEGVGDVDLSDEEMDKVIDSNVRNYSAEFVERHNAIVQILCDIEKDLTLEFIDDETRRDLLAEKRKKRTEYFELITGVTKRDSAVILDAIRNPGNSPRNSDPPVKIESPKEGGGCASLRVKEKQINRDLKFKVLCCKTVAGDTHCSLEVSKKSRGKFELCAKGGSWASFIIDEKGVLFAATKISAQGNSTAECLVLEHEDADIETQVDLIFKGIKVENAQKLSVGTTFGRVDFHFN